MKTFAFFAFIFVCATILCGFMEGTSGINATELSANIDEIVTTILVDSTEGFAGSTHPASQRYIIIGGEAISYTGLTETSFTGCVRGLTNPQTGDQRDASTHGDGALVTNTSTSAMNSLIAIFQAKSSASFGTFIALIFSSAFWTALWQMMVWDYSFFTGQLSILRIVLVVTLSGGFLFSIVMSMIGLAQGMFRR